MAKVLCVLYDDPVDGYPNSYARDDIPKLERYPGGQTLPTPEGDRLQARRAPRQRLRRARPAQVSRRRGHTLVVTSDKDGPDSVFERELPDAEIVISQPFWPAYLTAERIAKAPKLKLAITAGIGSDHVDLQAAIERGITVAEVTYCNSISVAEHVVMMILSLVRNYIPSYQLGGQAAAGTSPTASRAPTTSKAWHVGTVAAGRIGTAVLRRLKPFDVKLHYTDRHRLPADVEQELALTFHPRRRIDGAASATSSRSTRRCIPRPSTCSTTRYRQDEARRLPREHGARQDLRPRRDRPRAGERAARRLRRRCLVPAAGAEGPPWRTMPHHGMTPHVSGTTLSAQARYAAGTREILECWFEGRPIRDEYLIVDGGKLAGAGAHSYSAGNATAGSDEAARFKK